MADYFNPSIPIAAVSGGGADALDGEDIVQAPALSSVRQTDQASDRLTGRPGESESMQSELGEDDIMEAMEAALVGESAELNDHITIRMSPEGLVIELTDRDARPPFLRQAAPILRPFCPN